MNKNVKAMAGVIGFVLFILITIFLLVLLSSGQDTEPAFVHESVGVPVYAEPPVDPLPTPVTNDHGQTVIWMWTDKVDKWLKSNKDKRLVSLAVETDSIYCIVYEGKAE